MFKTIDNEKKVEIESYDIFKEEDNRHVLKEKNARIEKISFLCSECRMEKTLFFCNELLECQVCEEQCMDKVDIENCVLGDECS